MITDLESLESNENKKDWKAKNPNLLPTEREGRTGEYWPEVVAVRTASAARSVQKRLRANIPQYGPEQVKLVSSLLYGIILRTKQHFRKFIQVNFRCDVKLGKRASKEPAILSGFRISLMIVAVDWQKLARLLNENCSPSIICVSFSSSSTTQDSFIWKYFFVMGGDNSEKYNEKDAIKSHKRASQTGNCGSVLVCNVNKGTLELQKKTLEIISPSNTTSCLLQWLYGELCGCWEQIFVALDKVVFSASYSKSRLVKKLKLFSRTSTIRGKISVRNQGTLLVEYIYV